MVITGNTLTCASSLPLIGTTVPLQESGMRIGIIFATIPTTMWRFSATTALSSNLVRRIVEPQGCVIRPQAKSSKWPLFGRATEDQRRAGTQ